MVKRTAQKNQKQFEEYVNFFWETNRRGLGVKLDKSENQLLLSKFVIPKGVSESRAFFSGRVAHEGPYVFGLPKSTRTPSFISPSGYEFAVFPTGFIDSTSLSFFSLRQSL